MRTKLILIFLVVAVGLVAAFVPRPTRPELAPYVTVTCTQDEHYTYKVSRVDVEAAGLPFETWIGIYGIGVRWAELFPEMKHYDFPLIAQSEGLYVVAGRQDVGGNYFSSNGPILFWKLIFISPCGS